LNLLEKTFYIGNRNFGVVSWSVFQFIYETVQIPAGPTYLFFESLKKLAVTLNVGKAN
jgi:hypothetical protein